MKVYPSNGSMVSSVNLGQHQATQTTAFLLAMGQTVRLISPYLVKRSRWLKERQAHCVDGGAGDFPSTVRNTTRQNTDSRHTQTESERDRERDTKRHTNVLWADTQSDTQLRTHAHTLPRAGQGSATADKSCSMTCPRCYQHVTPFHLSHTYFSSDTHTHTHTEGWQGANDVCSRLMWQQYQ